MICFNCGWRLPDAGVTECGICGMKMPKSCLTCGMPNPRHARHCLACGRAFPDASRQDADADGAGAGALAEARRNVAVIFADVSGFTALSENLDPEEVRSIINDCFQSITQPVYELEGSIDKYIGDCVMVLFGARIPHADDARRAVSCALRMQAAMEAFSRERLETRGLSLKLSVGINYGLVVTGSIGGYFDKDYTVMGDTVNMAQRLQSAAQPGTVLVSGPVHDETRDLFAYHDMGDLTVKNRREPVRCWRAETELQDLAADGLLIERDLELAQAGEAAAAFEAGRFVFCAMTGDAGIGKTVLSLAFMRIFEQRSIEGFKAFRTECGTDDRRRPYGMLSSLLHALMNVETGGSANARRYRVASYCYFLLPDAQDGEVERLVGFLGIFMGLERTSGFQEILDAMKPGDLEREMTDQLQRFLDACLRSRPTLLVLDDLQWADERSVGLLVRVLPRLVTTRSAWLCVFRPDPRLERMGSFRFLSDAHVFSRRWHLAPLTEDGAVRCVIGLAGAVSSDGDLAEPLARMTHGNPLMVGEFTRTALRRGGIEVVDGQVRIRSVSEKTFAGSLGNILLAGIVEMPQETITLLQTAAVVGSSFRFTWMQGLAGIEDPEWVAAPAVRAGILSIRSVQLGGGTVRKEGRFVHVLAREALYGSLLLAQRQKLHLAVATHLERMAGNDASEISALLSHQFEMAGDRGRAARHAYNAAGRSEAGYDARSAKENWFRFLDLSGVGVLPILSMEAPGSEAGGAPGKATGNLQADLPAPPSADVPADDGAASDSGSVYGVPAASGSSPTDGLQARAVLVELLGSEGPELVVKALRHLASLEWTEGRGETAMTLLRRAHEWAESLRDRLDARLAEAEILRETGRFDEAAVILDELVGRSEADADLQGKVQLCRCTLLRMRSDPGAAEAARRAEELFRRGRDWRGLAETLSQTAGIHFARGELPQAKQVLENALGYAEKSRDIGMTARLYGNLSILHLAAGETALARNGFAKAIELAAKVSNLHSLLSSQINLGILRMEQGKFDSAAELLGDVVRRSRQASLRYQECLAWINLGDLAIERGRKAEAENAYAQAVALAVEQDLGVEKALCDVGLAHVRSGRMESFGAGAARQGAGAEMAAGESITRETMPADELKTGETLPDGEPMVGMDASVPTMGDDENMLAEARSMLLAALPVLRGAGEEAGASDCLRVMAHVTYMAAVRSERADHGIPQAEDEARQALSAAEDAGNGMKRVKALRLLGILKGLAGEADAAAERCRESLAEAERLESDLEAAKSAFRLAEILQRAGAGETVVGEWMNRSREHARLIDACAWRDRILGA